VVLASPWILGGQLLVTQIVSLAIVAFAIVVSSLVAERSIKIPLALLFSLTAYILVQYANPAFAQEWQTGLRIWNLKPLDHIQWLPSSIDSDFADSSPLRFLIVFLTASLCASSIYKYKRRFHQDLLPPLLVINAALIALVGLIQLNLESRSILGLFEAADEGLALFFGTFLYKNHAAAFFNLGMAVSLACFFGYVKQDQKRKSNPGWLFLIFAGVLFAGVIFSKSRFGFLCSCGILALFGPLALTQLRDSGLSRKWVTAVCTAMIILTGCGGIYLLQNNAATHLKTLNSQITEDFSFKQRRLAYESELSMFAEKPIFGWGAGNYRHGFRQFQNMEGEREEIRNPYMNRRSANFFWQHAHNDYLEWLIELGVVGTLILLSIPGYFFWLIFKSKRWKEPVPLMLLAGLGSTMVHALIDFPFQNPAVLITWFAILTITGTYCGGNRGANNDLRAEDDH
jgi:O-antigen ligase